MTEIARKSIGADSAIETKAMSEFEIKDADRGEVVAVVSTMNVVDRDGDVILGGAIREGATVKLSGYDHDVITEGKPPVGRGVINMVGDRAVLTAKYFLSTERGREAFNMVKELGPESEWSIGFPKRVKTEPMTDAWKAKGARRLISELTVLESSPVFMGANAMTGTLAAKAAETLVDDETRAAEVAEPVAVVETKAQMVKDLVVELKAARENVARLEKDHANLVAKEIFDRFRRNFKS